MHDHLSDWEPSYLNAADRGGIERARELMRGDLRLRAGTYNSCLPVSDVTAEAIRSLADGYSS